MSKSTTDLAVTVAALQTQIARLNERLTTLEACLEESEPESAIPADGGRSKDAQQSQTRSRGHLADPVETFSAAIHQTLRQNRDKKGASYAICVGGIIAQSGGTGSVGTSYTLYTVDSEENLISDEQLSKRIEEYRRLLTDPLILRIFRYFLARRFAGEPPQATAAALGEALAATAEQIDAVLQPLVQDQTLKRGLYPDGVPFYEWDGNSHQIMAVLFFHR